jgi:hypothetical protein
MRKIALSLAVLATMLLPVLYAAPAHAQNQRIWVSNAGATPPGNNANTTNGCSVTQPCLTFAGALGVTNTGGEINCLTSGDFGNGIGFVITKSITIDCHDVYASVLDFSSEVAIEIDVPGGVVTLRNLNIDGAGESDAGIYIAAASTVYIEDVVVTGSSNGIDDIRSGGGTRLFIRNSVIRNNTGPGVVAAAAATNAVVLENVHSVGNKYGVAAATGNDVVVSRSVMSGNSVAGVEADPGAQVSVDNTEITHNISYGVQAYGTITLANSDISYNSAAIFGATISYGNNRIFGNPEASTAPTPIGAITNDHGQQ